MNTLKKVMKLSFLKLVPSNEGKEKSKNMKNFGVKSEISLGR